MYCKQNLMCLAPCLVNDMMLVCNYLHKHYEERNKNVLHEEVIRKQ